ncbi:MAG: DHH family phosphoesterase [Bacilli bacterium]
MSQNKKNKKFNKFLNYVYEPYANQKLTISRALHFSKFYSLIALVIEVVVCTILLIISAVVDTTSPLLSPTSILIMFLGFLLVDTVIVYIRLMKIGSISYRTDLDVARVLGNDVKEAYDFAKIGMAVVDDNNVVIWVNEFLFSRQVKILDLNIYDCFEELTQLTEQKDVVVKINNIAYEVRYIQDSNLFIFKDISAYTEEHENAVNESLVIGSLIIDTYDELQRTTESKKFNQMILNTVNDIDKYFGLFDCLVLPTANEDSYTILCSYSNFEKIQEDKFSLMDDIRKNSKSDSRIALTISIGFGYGFNESINSLYERATRAASTALKRGGDQIVISSGNKQEVIGGQHKIERQQNLVKYRTYAQQLSYYIRESSRVIISGHKNSDLDSLGASLGLFAFVQTVKKNDGSHIPAHVVFDGPSSQINAQQIYSQFVKKSSIKNVFVNSSNVNDLIDDKTLLILADVHNPGNALVSDYFDLSNNKNTFTRIVIFDHHMKNTSDVDLDPLLEFIDPSISSASEMITHLLEYTEETVKLPQEIADTMLSGIMLDTSFFKNRVDSSTFYACNNLVQHGANQNTAVSYLKETYETYQLKCTLSTNMNNPDYIDNFYVRNGLHIFIICALDPKNPTFLLDKDILAKVAEEHVATKDVDACFVIGKIDEDTYYASSRGNGKINVQRICESFKDGNGGGEFDRAAVLFHIENVTIFDIKEKIKEKILELTDDVDYN